MTVVSFRHAAEHRPRRSRHAPQANAESSLSLIGPRGSDALFWRSPRERVFISYSPPAVKPSLPAHMGEFRLTFEDYAVHALR